MGFFFFNHKLSPIYRTSLLSRGIYFKDHQQTVHLSKKERKNCGWNTCYLKEENKI